MLWATCVAGIRVMRHPVHPHVRGDGYIVRIHPPRPLLRHACADRDGGC